MRKDKRTKVILLAILILFLSVSVTTLVFAYGGGGKNPASESDSAVGGPPVDEAREYTREELNAMFSGLPTGIRELVIGKQEGKPRTKAQLIKILRIFLQAQNFRNQAESIDANAWADLVGYWTDLAIFMDKRGKDAEFILSFVPAAGWMSGTAFGAVRAGIDKYAEGKGIKDIAQAMAVSVAVDQIMKVGSLSKLGKRGDELVDMIQRADKLKRNSKVTQYLRRVGRELFNVKIEEKLTKDQIGKVLGYIADQARAAEVKPVSPPPSVPSIWNPFGGPLEAFLRTPLILPERT
ncbi:MAG: hypothetical protein K8S13_07960 [Desulfobacula sp.]|uniref:hypothetical protein n=1 Tax=Desulfobacula sp. TaxID=2593537 RepID=UPI0025BE768C|nr:hypothetical protein [Desulfobacula sp.]MCD4719782.1 hypothetical protein [Desulfobacula sp.]